MDSDCLIKLTKISCKEQLAASQELIIPASVLSETSGGALPLEFDDARVIRDNVRSKRIKVADLGSDDPGQRRASTLDLLGGEADAARLFWRGEVDLIASDDRAFTRVARGIGIRVVTSASLVILLSESGAMPRREAREKLERLRGLIPEAQYDEARKEIGDD